MPVDVWSWNTRIWVEILAAARTDTTGSQPCRLRNTTASGQACYVTESSNKRFSAENKPASAENRPFDDRNKLARATAEAAPTNGSALPRQLEMVRIRLLGAIEATDPSGAPVDLGPEKCRAVLAALALSVGEAVPVSRIIDLVWGASPPRTADKTLQSYVTRLRKGLGADVITRTGAAYRLQLRQDAVDIVRFQQLVEVEDSTGALDEWTGTPLAGLEDGGFQPIVDGLVEQWLGAVETELSRQIEHDAGSAIGRLTELTADYPFREGLWALLMTALYRVGRQADALAAYRRARQQLVDQLGVEPGPRLRALEASILDQDEQLTGSGWSTTKQPGLPTGTVTIAFADVVGTAELWSVDRQALTDALTAIDRQVRTTADQTNGHLFNVSGESFGVAFHRPSEAFSWATALQGAIQNPGEPEIGAIRIRIGINTGETEDRGPGYFGPAVNIASELAAVGHGGQTLVSAATATLLDGAVELNELGTFRLDGVIADQRILQLGPGEHPPLRTEEARKGNLPRRLGQLLGREQDLQTLNEAFRDSSAVTLIGPGGIGKTRLALAAARVAKADFTDGAWLIELAGIAASGDVSRAVADAMQIRENPSLGLTGSIVSALRTRQSLIVLDNCEHVIDGAADFAAAVLDECPDIRLLSTSREGLGISGERLMAVSPLEPDGAGVELFVERACSVAPSFDPSADKELIAEICRRLDGVPLAIELAAARIKTLSPADLIDRLDNRLRLLSGGRRSSVERHRTLRATVQWSYDLLAPADQALFRRLSVFAGPFDLAAAEQIAIGSTEDDQDAPEMTLTADIGGPDSAFTGFELDMGELLGGLVDRSMLIVESGTFGRRFRLLETMRQFGSECLSEAGNTDLVAERHANWCLEQVKIFHRGMTGHDEVLAVTRLNELWPNLRAGFDWACAIGDRRLAYRLVRPVAAEILLRAQTEIGDWLERLLELPADEQQEPIDEEILPFCLLWAAHRYTIAQNHDAYDRLVERYGEPDHPWVRYGRAFLFEDPEGLAAWGPDAEALAIEKGELHMASLIELGARGQSLLSQGRFEELDDFANNRSERYRSDGPPTLLTFSLAMMAYSALLQGKEQEAERFFEQAASVDTPDRTLGIDTAIQTRTALRRGQPELALEYLKQHIDQLLSVGNLYMTRMAAVDFINAMYVAGRIDEAAMARGYLSRPDLLDIEMSRSLVSPDVSAVPLSPEAQKQGQELDARTALEHMQAILAGTSKSVQ